MKNKFIQYYTIAFYLCATCVLFAQPGTGTTTTTVEDNLEAADTPTASIDAYLWVLMGLGLIFVLFKYKAILNQNKL